MARTIYRQDYTPPAFWVDDVELEFELEPEDTTVTARLRLRRNSDCPSTRLELDGEQLELQRLLLDGEPVSNDRFEVTDSQLLIDGLPDQCLLETKVVVHPAANKSLYGLYQSSGNFCTQCEALGFRRITYFLDRPDVMASYRVTLRARRDSYPVLLSNGNRIAERQLEGGRHEVVWEDPFPKPSYLFALVAGDLKCHRGTFVTRSDREVTLEIWVEPQNIDRCQHAMESLQKAMQWDEQTFGLEYDLDIYMIVAVNDFNMGAMENKGLNIFNSKYVLASQETATDDDYLNIEAIVAHEYFHNWTGNRVTCRDWFQLTLKEGLTVFRDQQFTADQTSAAVKRIDDVTRLRSRQFREDAGPMAHPIRPESYISMDNFYTTTVYEKGAEIIRIYHTLLGDDGFRRGMDLYVARHDGQAVTCDDFRRAMADANQVDFELLDRWYSQPGTPVLTIEENWNSDDGRYTLSFHQSYPELPAELPGAAGRQPVPIPIAVGLLGSDGRELPLQMLDDKTDSRPRTRVLQLDGEAASFTFVGLRGKPVPSLLRSFSAPVRLQMGQTASELAFLMTCDSDPFNRWDACQTLAMQILVDYIRHPSPSESLKLFIDAFGQLLIDDALDGSFKSLLLTLPSEEVIAQELDELDPDLVHGARQFLGEAVASAHAETLLSMYGVLDTGESYRTDQQSIDQRRLKKTVLRYLSLPPHSKVANLAAGQFEAADNMTDTQAALEVLVDLDCPQREDALARFYDRWRTDPPTLDKWFAVQAGSKREGTLERVIELTAHPDFVLTNPNRVRALLGAFSANQVRFHRRDGAGYRVLADFVLRIDPDNPQLAARLVSALNNYRQLEKGRQQIARAELERIAGRAALSKDVKEIIQRALTF